MVIKRVLDHAPDVGHFLEYFMATGNVKSRSGLSLQQVRAKGVVGRANDDNLRRAVRISSLW